MLTLITGTPGSGKSLHAVWELLRPLQSATVEVDGEPVKRVLYTNVKNLLLDHELITGDHLNTWHEWAKPGAVIAFDEVQEVWRPRSMGSKVPDCIAKLETHRHMAVDMVLITQHPNLLDQNIRRLVGRHLHVRRIGNMPLAIVYEWDHCSNPSMVRNAMSSRPWRYPGKKGYALYKSAEAHTKQPRKVPTVLFLLLLFLAIGAGLAPVVYGRMSDTFGGARLDTSMAGTLDRKGVPASGQGPARVSGGRPASGPAPAPAVPSLAASAPAVVAIGCVRMAERCACFDPVGERQDKPADYCHDKTGGNLPAKVADIPASLDRFEAPARWTPDPHHAALMAWSERQADQRRAAWR